VSVCLSAAARPHYCTDLDVTWGSGRGYILVVYYWADLQSAHGVRCYGNITRTRNVSEYMFVLALCLVSPAETDKPIEMPFGLRTLVGSENHALDGGRDLPWEGAIFG